MVVMVVVVVIEAVEIVDVVEVVLLFGVGGGDGEMRSSLRFIERARRDEMGRVLSQTRRIGIELKTRLVCL